MLKNGRLKTAIRTMPRITPGIKNGIHKAIPAGHRQASNPSATQTVAAAAPKAKEFHKAICPAAAAESSSDQARRVVASWNKGNPSENPISRTAAKPHRRDHG